jgi:apolipoprotein D and lipocalin family protein
MNDSSRIRAWLCRAALLLGVACLAFLAPGSARAEPAALQPIARLDVPRYLGTWYEVAKLPNWFQRKCAEQTQAQYRLQGAGQIEVLNTCRRADGTVIQAQGLARQIGAADSPRLQVRFAPAWLSFLPVVWGDYWVIDLDDSYQLAAVSEPRRAYLWILSRTPQPDPQRYQALIERLKASGFDLSALERTPQR